MNVPSPWIALLLLGFSYRIWRLLAEDTILSAPRYYLVGLPIDWEDGDPIPDGYRITLASFISCAWCLGFWVSLAVWGAWIAFPTVIEFIAVPFAISSGVGLVRARIDEIG